MATMAMQRQASLPTLTPSLQHHMPARQSASGDQLSELSAPAMCVGQLVYVALLSHHVQLQDGSAPLLWLTCLAALDQPAWGGTPTEAMCSTALQMPWLQHCGHSPLELSVALYLACSITTYATAPSTLLDPLRTPTEAGQQDHLMLWRAASNWPPSISHAHLQWQ